MEDNAHARKMGAEKEKKLTDFFSFLNDLLCLMDDAKCNARIEQAFKWFKSQGVRTYQRDPRTAGNLFAAYTRAMAIRRIDEAFR
jgi:hypothetical protein